MRIEAVYARIPSSIRSVAHGSVEESPCWSKDPRRRSQWRLSEGEIGSLSILRSGGEPNCCSCGDGEQDSCGLVFEEEGREGEGGYVRRHARRAVRCYYGLFQRSFAVFLTFTSISMRCSCLRRCLYYARSRKAMPFVGPGRELDDLMPLLHQLPTAAFPSWRSAELSLARMGADHADDLQPRRRSQLRPLSLPLSLSSSDITSSTLHCSARRRSPTLHPYYIVRTSPFHTHCRGLRCSIARFVRFASAICRSSSRCADSSRAVQCRSTLVTPSFSCPIVFHTAIATATRPLAALLLPHLSHHLLLLVLI